MMEFIYYLGYYPQHRGVPGNRYSKIGKELGISKHRVKDLVMLYEFFQGEGNCVLESVFGKEISINQGNKLKKIVYDHPEKFDSEEVFKKFCNGKFDFNRLEYSVKNLDPRDDLEFEIIKSFLLKDFTLNEFHKKLEQLGKVEGRVQKHNESKVNVPEIDENYKSKHVQLYNSDNREFKPLEPFSRLIKCIIGSPPYGNLRLNGDDPGFETGHNMTGHEYGVYLSETYSKYKEYMDSSGSIYIIINDYRNENGSFSLSLEHLVVEMERKGYYLVGRYIWWKNNPQPRSYNVKNMTNGFEMVYRFSPDPEKCYFNSDLFLELDEREKRLSQGCTNTDNKGNTTRGTSYVQSHLKKVRDTLDDQICMDVIRGNVSNPEDFFRQVDEKRHTSTSPIYLTSTLILESTKPDDLVVDIWGGVGNTMVSSLLLGRDYIGIEKEENYFKQTQRRLQMTEQMIQDISVVSDDDLRMLPAA
jgi:DNA modification methylase